MIPNATLKPSVCDIKLLMGDIQSLFVKCFILFFLWNTFAATQPGLAQTNADPAPTKTPEDIQFTNRMSRADRDQKWSITYLESYNRTKEIPYLKLSSTHCLRAIRLLAETQSMLLRTNKFYNQAEVKRLEACRLYSKIRKRSFLLDARHHLKDSGAICD